MSDDVPAFELDLDGEAGAVLFRVIDAMGKHGVIPSHHKIIQDATRQHRITNVKIFADGRLRYKVDLDT